MTKEWVLMGLSAALMVIAAVTLTIAYEYFSYRRKDDRERDLHERMGLHVKDDEAIHRK